MSACIKCGRENNDSQKFCASCGSHLPPSLGEFLSEAGLGEHLETFRKNDLLSLGDLLALSETDLLELQLPYGDLLRLRNALSNHRAGSQPADPPQSPPAEPALPEPSSLGETPRPDLSSAPAASVSGKVIAGIFTGVVVLVIVAVVAGGDPNREARISESPSLGESVDSTGSQDVNLEALRAKAHIAEKEKADAQRLAAEREAESLRLAAERAEQEKDMALQRAALAEQQAAHLASQQQAPSLEGLDGFLQSYFQSLASNNQWDAAAHYADSLQYGYAKSSSGRASRNQVADDLRKLISSYPNRSYSNISVKEIIPNGPGSARINYGFDYQYSGKKLAMGSTDVWATVELIGGQWQITSWRETVNRIR